MRHTWRQSLLATVAIVLAGTTGLDAADDILSASSYLGGSASNDCVRGARIQSNGTIVLAANIGNAAPGGLQPVLLLGSGVSSSGAIVRLSGDGATVLSVTRIAGDLWDLALDGSDNIIVAARNVGVIKLNPEATSVLWLKSNGGSCERVDAAANGDVVALNGSFADFGDAPTGGGTVYLYDPAGNQLGVIAGHNLTYDVAINGAGQSIYLAGYKQTSSAAGLPIEIAYLKCQGYDGIQKWKSYDWSGQQVESSGSLASTRAVRISVGADNLLYAGFTVNGENHIFRYDPFNISNAVSIVGGDQYHTFTNTGSEQKTFFARYNLSTGAYGAGQQLCGRGIAGQGSTCRIDKGDIRADNSGQVYLAGSAIGTLPFTFNPVPATEDGGGPFALIMSANLTTRVWCGRVCSRGEMAAIDAKSTASIVFGGSTGTSPTLFTRSAIQSSSATASDGFFCAKGTGGNTGGGTGGGTAPVITAQPSAAINPVTDISTTLRVTATDDGGEANLTYTWNTAGTPPAGVSFGISNGSNAAKSCSATFVKSGIYDFQVVVRDSTNMAATSSILSVTVQQTAKTITITPPHAFVVINTEAQFSAVVADQFSEPIAQAPLTWAVAGGGTINPATGLFNAGTVAGGPWIVTAWSGTATKTANVSVTLTGPKITGFASGPTASATTAAVLTPIQFNAVPSGTAPFAWNWSFGDGGSDFSGGSVSHSYAATGVYTVSVTATDSAGNFSGGSLTITITEAGSGGGGIGGGGGDGGGNGGGGGGGGDNAGGSISGGLSAPTGRYEMFVTRFTAGLKFDAEGHDSCSINGTILSIPALYDPTGAILFLNVGGVQTSFTLDEKGRAKTDSSAVTLKMKGKRNKLTKKLEFVGGNIPYKIQLRNTNLTGAWADEGIDPASNSDKVTVMLDIEIGFAGFVHVARVENIYSSKAHKGGKLKNK